MNIWDRNNQEVSITLENQTSGLMIGRQRSLITGNDRNDRNYVATELQKEETDAIGLYQEISPYKHL